MSKRLTILIAALLVLGFTYAGCGGDDEPATTTDTVTDVETVTDDEVVTDTETVTEPTDTTETAETTATSEGGGAAAPDVRQAIASCKRAVTAYPQLSDDTKSDLEQLCEKAGSGDAEDAREASRDVCRKIIEDLYPSGVPGKGAALKACESSIR